MKRQRKRGPYGRRPVIETVEMADGRVYSTQDNWVTIFVVTPAGKQQVLDREEAEQVRFIALNAT